MASQPPLIEPTPRPLRVLVVDDHDDTAVTTALLMRVFGHLVEVASNGPAALEAARLGDPDVVLLDLAMPGMDGLELARRLRDLAGVKRPLLVAISGYGREVDRQRSAEAGIDLHFVKPVDSALLGKILARFHDIVTSVAEAAGTLPNSD